jgi:hypothetical protein
MLRFVFVASLAAMVVLLSGCQVSTKPRTFASVSGDGPVKVAAAEVHGEYRLYTSQTAANGFPRPVGDALATHRLRRGQPVGFRRDAGQLQAIAGDAARPLERGSYLWQVRADPGQFDKKGTTVVVLTGVAVALAITVAAVGF